MLQPTPTATLHRRQLWAPPSSTTTTPDLRPHCTPFILPSNGILSLASDAVITLTTDVVFAPQCSDTPEESGSDVSSTDTTRNPFYASTIPQTYVIAAATIIAWILLVMLVITPRSRSLSHGFGTGRGIIGGASGGSANLVGVGSRPWLQKAATLTVAVALTIATADTFKVAEQQYHTGYMDSDLLRSKVLYSLEIRIVRVISDVFVWLAQVQTLIRLFPRHKEKVLIKWIGFALIIFDTIFSCLNAFLIKVRGRPGQFVDAIPALSYLFELALGLLYAAWVLYYVLAKRRYAFYHPKMRNISIIALISIIAILTPVVFFVTDVLNQDVGGWGDYFRWVGATAASVVVWEWVERIEALERDEKKDGILGREVFDGDEMLEATPTDDVIWHRGRHDRNYFRKGGGDGKGGDGDAEKRNVFDQGTFSGVAQKLRQRQQPAAPQHFPLGRAHSSTTATTIAGLNGNSNRAITFGKTPRPNGGNKVLGMPTPPPPVASPINRAENNASGASTVYVIHYDDSNANAPSPIRRRPDAPDTTAAAHKQQQKDTEKEEADLSDKEEEPKPVRSGNRHGWHGVANPFKRKRASPPAVVQQAARQSGATSTGRASTPVNAPSSRWELKKRFGTFAAQTSDRVRDRTSGRAQDVDFPVTVIPAQTRGTGRTWSPEVVVHEQQQQHDQSRGSTGISDGPSSQSTDETRISGTTQVASSSGEPSPSAHPQLSQQTASRPTELGSLPTATAASPNVTRHSQSTSPSPPRADDLTPTPGQGPVIVPAPQRRSPFRTTPPTSLGSGSGSGSTGERRS